MMMEAEDDQDNEDQPQQKRKKQDEETQDEGFENVSGAEEVEMDIVDAVQPKKSRCMCIQYHSIHYY